MRKHIFKCVGGVSTCHLLEHQESCPKHSLDAQLFILVLCFLKEALLKLSVLLRLFLVMA